MDIEKEIDNIISKNHINIINDNLYLTNEEISVLNSYNINYSVCNSMKDLISLIENTLLDEELEDIEDILINISERDYYSNTRK